MKVLIVMCLLVASLVGSSLADDSTGGGGGGGQGPDGLSDRGGQQSTGGWNSDGSQATAADSTGRSSSKSNSEKNNLQDDKKGSEAMYGKPDLKHLEKNKPKEDLYALVAPIEHFFKFALDPLEFAKKLSFDYQLNFEKVTAFLGKNLLTGLEAGLAPLFVSIKVVEKMFVTDACSLRYVCKMGAQMDYARGHVSKMPVSILEGTVHLKALTDGIIGKDCEATYAGCAKKNSMTVRRALQDEAGLNFGPVANLIGGKQTSGGTGGSGGGGGLQLPTPVLVPIPTPVQMPDLKGLPDLKALQQQMEKFLGVGGETKANNGSAKNPLEVMNFFGGGGGGQPAGKADERKEKLLGLF